jgi:hypothetical protein
MMLMTKEYWLKKKKKRKSIVQSLCVWEVDRSNLIRSSLEPLVTLNCQNPDNIDVNLVSQRQIRIIRNNSAIIECESAIFEQRNDSRTFVISSFVFRIFVFLDNDEFQERSRVMFKTNMIIDRSANHTYFEEICDFARFVNHLFLNDISQNFVTIQDKIRKFCTNDVVDSFRSQKSIFRSQKH